MGAQLYEENTIMKAGILCSIFSTEDLASAVCQAGGDRAALEVLSRSTSTEMILHAAVALLCNIALHGR